MKLVGKAGQLLCWMLVRAPDSLECMKCLIGAAGEGCADKPLQVKLKRPLILEKQAQGMASRREGGQLHILEKEEGSGMRKAAD